MTMIARVDALAECEAIIEQNALAFVATGKALMRIRDERLYEQAGFSGFVEYLESKSWGIDRRRSYKMIDAARVSECLPHVANERQAAELAPLFKRATPAVVKQVYEEAVQETDGKPTAAAIREKVRRVLRPSPPSVEDWIASPSRSRRWETLSRIVTDLRDLRLEWGDEPVEDVPINEAARRVREYDRLIAFLQVRRDELAVKGHKLLPREETKG